MTVRRPDKDKSSRNWSAYKNGNALVFINRKTGTKIRWTKDDAFRLDFPESIDLIVSKRCNNCCDWCYMGCSPIGKEADLKDTSNILEMMPHTEIAMNINSEIPDGFKEYLEEYMYRDILVNATIHLEDWLRHREYLGKLREEGLLYGIGISYSKMGWLMMQEDKASERALVHPMNVLHIVNGLADSGDIAKIRRLKPKLLVLGYKTFGRGSAYEESHSERVRENMHWLEKNIKDMFMTMPIVSFDNLALEQLDIKNKLDEDVWDECYMGDEGSSTLAVDLVSQKFALHSMEPEEKWYPIEGRTPEQMYQYLQCIRIEGNVC